MVHDDVWRASVAQCCYRQFSLMDGSCARFDQYGPYGSLKTLLEIGMPTHPIESLIELDHLELIRLGGAWFGRLAIQTVQHIEHCSIVCRQGVPMRGCGCWPRSRFGRRSNPHKPNRKVGFIGSRDWPTA